MTHEHPQPSIEPRSEFADALREIVESVLPLLTGLDADVATEAEILSALAPANRTLALVVRGPAATHGFEADRDQCLVRLDYLSMGADIIAPAASLALGREGGLSQQTIDAYWRAVLGGGIAARLSSAAALALSPSLPVSLTAASDLRGITDHDVAACVGLAVGAAARAHDDHALSLLYEILGGAQAASPLLVGLVKGLGAGLFLVGMERLSELAESSVFRRREAWRALRGAACHLLGPVLAAEVELDPIGDCLLRLAHEGHGVAPEDFWQGFPEALVERWVAAAATVYATLPALARLVVVQSVLANPGAADPVTILRDYLRIEQSGPVVVLLLEAEGAHRCGDLSEWVSAWGGIADRELRTRLGHRLAAHHPQAPAQAAGGADVIALPPAAMARDDLDRLRLALFELDGERLVELASRVPLDRRQDARAALLASLDIPDSALRRGAIDSLGRVGGITDVPTLVDAARRFRALEGSVAAALRELNARGASEPLAEVFKRRLKWADDDAVDDWWGLAGEDSVRHLVAGLDVRYYPLARAGAARALARFRVHEVVFALRTAALTDPSDRARLAAHQALTELTGSGPSQAELAGFGIGFRPIEDISDAIDKARDAGLAALPGLRRTLVRASWQRRVAACEALSGIEGTDAEEILIEALQDVDEDVRMSATEALLQRGWVPGDAGQRTLVALATHNLDELLGAPELADPDVLFEALELGGHVARQEALLVIDTAGLSGLTETASHNSRRYYAARNDIYRLRGQFAGLQALLVVADKTWQSFPHRARIVRSLTAWSAVALRDALSDGSFSWRARQAVAEALSGRDDSDAVAVLTTFMRDDEDDVRKAALESLASCAYALSRAGRELDDVAAALSLALESPFPDDREQAAATIGALGPRLRRFVQAWAADPWWEVRHAAAIALSRWVRDTQQAAGILLGLAVDPEFKVADAARSALGLIGLLPDVHARCLAIGHATTLSLHGNEAWFGVHTDLTAHPDLAIAVDQLVDTSSADVLAKKIGIIACLRVEHLAGWLEDMALGRVTSHIGVRLAASGALRALVRQECQVCSGATTLVCPACEGLGDGRCPDCSGRGLSTEPCPNAHCSATQVPRRIDSPRCPTCGGRGHVHVPCQCQVSARPGREICGLCLGRGRIHCVACVPDAATPP